MAHTAKQLKKIAKDNGIEFNKMASAEQMLALLVEKGVEIPLEIENSDEGSADAENFEGEFVVMSNLKHDGNKYAKGDVIFVDDKGVADRLVADGVLKLK